MSFRRTDCPGTIAAGTPMWKPGNGLTWSSLPLCSKPKSKGSFQSESSTPMALLVVGAGAGGDDDGPAQLRRAARSLARPALLYASAIRRGIDARSASAFLRMAWSDASKPGEHPSRGGCDTAGGGCSCTMTASSAITGESGSCADEEENDGEDTAEEGRLAGSLALSLPRLPPLEVMTVGGL